MVKSIESKEEYLAILESAGNTLVVIDFTAVWCGPCKRIAPTFEALAQKHSDVQFYKVDVDDVADLAQHCGISAMPTFHFLKCKKKVDEVCGADEAQLQKKIQQWK